MLLSPTPSDLFFSRNDPQDLRIGDLAQAKTLQDLNALPPGYVLVGFPDDTGIQNNKGRPGAKEAPNSIRKYFYKFTDFIHKKDKPHLYDLGNLAIQTDILETHELAENVQSQILNHDHKLISLGGGHDFGYPDGMAFLKKNSSAPKAPLIINIDAHLDVRSDKNGINSGTPFYRLLQSSYRFDLLQIGIQEHCNSRLHFDFCQNHPHVQILTWEEISLDPHPLEKILKFINPFIISRRPCFLSVDIDSFSSSYAKGCSQSWSTGFSPDLFFNFLRVLTGRLPVDVLGIYEVSPPLDVQERTSQLAAQIIYNFIKGQQR